MEFPELFTNLLKEYGVTQAQLSRETGIPKTTISGWLNAGRLPDYNSLRILSVYFGISADELLQLRTDFSYYDEDSEILRAYKKAEPRIKKQIQKLLDRDR